MALAITPASVINYIDQEKVNFQLSKKGIQSIEKCVKMIDLGVFPDTIRYQFIALKNQLECCIPSKTNRIERFDVHLKGIFLTVDGLRKKILHSNPTVIQKNSSAVSSISGSPMSTSPLSTSPLSTSPLSSSCSLTGSPMISRSNSPVLIKSNMRNSSGLSSTIPTLYLADPLSNEPDNKLRKNGHQKLIKVIENAVAKLHELSIKNKDTEPLLALVQRLGKITEETLEVYKHNFFNN